MTDQRVSALPLTDDEMLAKFRDCAQSRLRPDEIERSVELALGLERAGDIKTLTAMLGATAVSVQ